MAPHGLRFGGVALSRRDLQHSGDGLATPTLYVGITIPRFSEFVPDLVPATLGPDPNFDPWGYFPKVAKRFWPLWPPIGLRFETFAITRRGLTVSGDGFALKRPVARDRHPAIFQIFPPVLWPYSPGVADLTEQWQ